MDASHFPTRNIVGIRPAGIIHLGNYFGAIVTVLEAQNRCPTNNFCFVADYHAKVGVNPKTSLSRDTEDVVIAFIASNIDPRTTCIYRQSDVPEVFEIMWILSLMMRSAELLTSDLMKRPVPTAAAYLYPLLMAADILGIRATSVSVGDDQQANVSYVRQVADNVNTVAGYGFFPIPMRANESIRTVPGIDSQPGQHTRMSRSSKNIIPVFCDPDETRQYVDNIPMRQVRHNEPMNPEGDTILALYAYVSSSEETEELRRQYLNGSLAVQDAKEILTAKLNSYFLPHRTRWAELHELQPLRRVGAILDILREGSERVRAEMQDTLQELRDLVGLGRPRRWSEEG